MKITKRCRRYFAVLTAVLFTGAVFAVTAFAVEDQAQEAQRTEGNSSAVSVSGPSSQPESVPDSTQAPSGSSGESSNESSGADSSGSGTDSSSLSSEESSSQSQPAESSKKPGESSEYRPPSSSKRPPVSIPAPETIASAPADSRTPTEFSSGDLEALLSSPGSESQADSSEGFFLENDQDQTGTGGGGGLSTLLLSGIALILAGLAGIGTFFYRQFLRKEPPQPATASDLSESASSGIYGDLFEQPEGAGKSRDYYDEAGDDYDQYAQYDKSGEAAPGYEEISSTAPEAPENAPEAGGFTDISSGRKHGVDSDGFDWDHFFQNNHQ